jgi:hypothetical protein
VIDTGNCFVEAGAWHDDNGRRLIILVNHDLQQQQTARLPDGTRIPLEPGQAKTLVRGGAL